MYRPRGFAVVAAITLAAVPARAHVAPSVDDNNRYLKLTPGADRIRLAYTVFFGEVPGASTRRTIDTDRDGRISDAEAQVFGTRLAGDVGPSLEVTLDGATTPVRWAVVNVGMGSPSTSGGAFSVDLVAYLCLPSPRGRHALALRDRFRVPRPGETEVLIESAPGITIERTRIGPALAPDHAYRFVGPGGPLADDGLELVFTASDTAPLASDGTCAAAPARGARGGMLAIVIGGGLAALAAVGVLVLRRPRRTRHKRR